MRNGTKSRKNKSLRVLISQAFALFRKLNGRGDRIRTCDICVPNAALYQAELLPVATLTKAVIYGGQKLYELSPKFKSKMNILTGSYQRLQKCS